MEARERDELAVNTIRFLAVDAVQKANSGHPGMPMGAATMVYVLWTRFLKHNPLNPTWPDRDRFVLSAGHGSMLLYSLLYLTGYDLPEEEIRNFRQWESRTPGHPEYDPELGVETTTGPLGQGFGNAVGMAIAEAFLAAYFNRPGHSIVNHYTYVIASDGDLMEGVSAEAASLAGHLRLGKLICLYDSNDITIEGSTQLAFTEDVGRRFEAYGWQVSRVPEGNDPEAIAQALKAAQAETQRPSLIIVRTHLAYGSPGKQDDASAHGAPLGEEEVRRTKQNLGWPLEPPFYVPPEVLAYMRQARERGAAWEAEWRERFASYAAAYPHLAADWERMMNRELPEGWTAHLPSFTPAQGPMATRDASGRVLNALAPHVPYLLGGSADLAPSNKTYLEDCGDFAAENYGGRNFHFGIREHAMGAILNGLTLHRGLIAFAGTFLVFSDYMRPSIRMAAMMKIPVIYVFTHDSIGVGEDGPTHQPIEQLAALRAIPHLTVIRPADANETVMAWRVALENRDGPVALILSRQKLPILDRTHLAPAEELARGAYILAEAKGGKPEIILIATGSEVHLALEAASQLTKEGWAVRVVNMPSWELFAAQPRAYREQVLPPEVPLRLAIEAGVPLGWERYVGDRGEVLGIERFGASAPGSVVMEKFGFSAENVVARVKDLLTR
ncbi:MAG TPA: transketolase [Armatimonadetes bacterium]|nr:transketolase [Armatimonadota bacterium]